MIKLKELLIKPISNHSLWILKELLTKFSIQTLVINEKQLLFDILRDISWYHGCISRDIAAELLNSSLDKEGCFLIRESSTIIDELVLSLNHDGTIFHYPIIKKRFGLCFQLHMEVDNLLDKEAQLIQGLDLFVSHYQKHLTQLPCLLNNFVYGHPPPSYYCKYSINHLIHFLAFAGWEKEFGNILAIFSKNIQENFLKLKNNICASILNYINPKALDGLTPLHIAIKNGHKNIVSMLLKFVESVIELIGKNTEQKIIFREALYLKIFTARDATGNSILNLICQFNQIAILRLLGDINDNFLIPQLDKLIHEPNPFDGNFPIHDAAKYGNLECLEYLLTFDKSMVTLLNLEKLSPLDLAIQKNQDICVKFIEHFLIKEKSLNKNLIVVESNIVIHKMNRSEAEDFLNIQMNLNFNDNENGIYILRYPSDKTNKSIILTMMYQKHCFHFEINCMSNQYFLDDGPEFSTLNQLFAHYHGISDGLPCLLTTMLPLKKETPKIIPRKKHNIMNDPHLRNHIASPFQEKFIDFKSINLLSEIGRGEFGSVFQGILTQGDNQKVDVGVKTLHPDYFPADKENFISEARVMMGLDHDCIVKLVGICPTATSIMMVQELAPFGSLLSYLPPHVDHIDIKYHFPLWASQIASGMRYLELQHFVHRDLAARNILVFSPQQVKITDFGLSRALALHSNYYKSTSGGKWPVKWYAPESVNYGRFSHASDVWGYGVTVWEMYAFGEPPYGEMSGIEVIQALEDGLRLPKPEACTDKIYRKLLECWSSRPHKRPNFKYLQTFFTENMTKP